MMHYSLLALAIGQIFEFTCPVCPASGLYGVLKVGGLLVGSAFIFDIDGVVTFLRLSDPFCLLTDPARGVIGVSPSNLPRISPEGRYLESYLTFQTHLHCS
jgi:hypothetical protein